MSTAIDMVVLDRGAVKGWGKPEFGLAYNVSHSLAYNGVTIIPNFMQIKLGAPEFLEKAC
jgi:hypothetical protein